MTLARKRKKKFRIAQGGKDLNQNLTKITNETKTLGRALRLETFST